MRKRMLVLMCILMAITLACNINLNGQGEPSTAEQTLQAIYIEQTVQAVLAEKTSEAFQQPETLSETIPAEPVPTRVVVHAIIPTGPGWISQWALDTHSNRTSAQKRAPGGDSYNQNLLERPFTANEMNYRPDVDLVRLEISQDANFYYFILHLSGINPETNQLSAHYGVEIDLNRNGRGDYLLWVHADNRTDWNIDNVFIYKDGNNDVGGTRPMRSDAPGHNGNGYDQIIFSSDHLDDPDMGWKRIDSAAQNVIQLAIKKSVLGNASNFMWSAWADDGLKDPGRFDYHDFFSLGEAGSPISSVVDYPLKAVFLVDNTCRLAYGFEPRGNEPGLCVMPEPAATPLPANTPPPANTLQPTVTPTCDCTDSQSLNSSQYCCELCQYYWTGSSCTLP